MLCSVSFDQPLRHSGSPCSGSRGQHNPPRIPFDFCGRVQGSLQCEHWHGSKTVHTLGCMSQMVPAVGASGVFGSHGSVGKLVRRHTMDSDAMQEASNSGRHGNSSGRHGSGSSTRCVQGLCGLLYATSPHQAKVSALLLLQHACLAASLAFSRVQQLQPCNSRQIQ